MENVEKKSRFSLKKMTAILLAVCLVTGAVPADSLWSVLAEAAESIADTVSGNASGQQLATNTDLQPADGNKPAEKQAKPAAGSGSDGQVQPAAGSGSDAPVMLAAASGSEGGMKLAAASGSEGQQEPAVISALQATIEQRLSAMETLTGLVQIILNKNTTYEGDVRIRTDRQVANDFELALDAEDIPAEGLVSAGTATVAGNLVFKGINVLMRGVKVDPKYSVSVEAAKLTYEGTHSGDTLTVNVLDGGSAMIVTGDGADTLAVNTKEGAESVEVRSGDGADTVTVERNGGEVALDTGDGNDSVTLKVYDSGAEESQAVTVETGKGNDTVNLQNADSGPVAIDTGAGNDSVNLDLRAGTGSLTVETGAGEDTVKVSNPEGDITDGRQNSLDIANAGGDDRIAVDVSVADVIGSVSITEGEDASGSVHLTGTLQPKLDKPIEGEAGAFTLTGEHGNKLAVTAGGETRFTDELKNKRVVTLTPDGTAFTYIAEDNFTDYVLAAPVSGLTDMSVTAVEPLTLSNLIVDTDKTLDNGNHLTVNNVDADGLNLVIRGETIDIVGKVNADSVRAEAAAGTGVHQSTLRLDSAEGAADSLAGMAADMFSVYDKAEINVAESAEIHAKNDIILQAGVSHSGGILTLAPDLNAVNVKAADSRISIGGTVSAGEKNGTGSLTAEAKNVTVMGYDANGMKTSGMPIAVSVAVDRAAVTVAGAAKIKASGNITLNAENSIKSATTAESGMAGAPFAAAVNVIVSHVQTAAGGTLEAGSNVTVQAKGRIDESLTASRGTGQESNSGGYVGVNVVEQEVNALVTDGAEISAKGNVTVRSDATANVSTEVTAAQPKKKPEAGSMTLDSAMQLAKAVWTPIRAELSRIRADSGDDASLDKFSKKLDAKLKTVADGNYSVTVAEPSANDERGTVTVNTETGANGYLYAKVKATAVPGAKVEKVRIRYLVPGEGHYTYAEPERTDDEGNQVFLINRANAEAIVTFSGAPDGTGSEPDAAGDGNMDLFGNDGEQDSGSVSEIFNTGAGGAAVSADEDEDIYGLQDLFDETKASKLTIEKAENGAVVTYLEEAEGQGLTSVAPGQKVLFVPNPAAGYKLSENSLTMSYTAMEEGQEVRKLDVIAPDSQGRYVFTVPDTLEAAYGLNLYARFEPGKEEKRGDSSNTQATGAVAVNITGNNNLAEIEEGATVNAGGSVNVTANETTNVTASADGTAVTSAGAEPEKGRKEKKPALKTVTEYRVGGARYAVRINATQYGRVSTAGNAAAGDLTFSVEEGTLNRALLSYRSSVTDKRVTEEITPDGNGKYRIQLVNYAIADGSTAEITFLFKETGDKTVHPNQYAVRNPIAVSFNAKALGKEQDPDGLDYEKLGEAASRGTDADGRYIFHVYATERGYTVAAGSGKTSNTAALWASYTDVKGKAQKVPLARDGEYWALDAQAAGIPAGTVITVCVVFSEDLHPVKASTKQANGKIAIDKDKAKDGDKVTVTLTADKDYAGTGVMVSWVGAKSLKKESAIYDADKDTGVVTFTMPKAAAEGTVTVGGIFAKKEITLKVSNAGEVKLSETGKAFAGEKVTVSPSDENVKKGKKVTQVALSWKDEDGAEKSSVSKTGKFTVPEGTKELHIEVTLADKPIEITALETEQGKVAAASARTEVGEKVKIKVQAAEGFRLKQGSLKAEISDRTSSRQIVPDRGSDGYSFTMPADVNPETCKVSFKAVFEEGDGGDGEKTSIGVSVAVSVVTGNNDAAIRGGSITAGKDVKVSADSTGKATAAAKAGYSAGRIGIGGAVSVQVASQDTRARIFADGEGFVSAGGTLTVSAGSNQTFAVTGDASGKAQASKAGVGAGIAVAVSGTETAAAIQDNTNLSGALKGITITAKQKVKDSVTAKAGAAGGTSVVPVAAVDVSGTKASAILGKAAEELAVAGNIKITSSSSAGHTLKADASATGGRTSLGGAFAVSVLNDSSEAEMSRTAKAKNITLSSRSDSDTSETATAGVSGGLKGKKDAKDSAGSADKQADKLLGGAVKLADKNGSSAVKSGDAAAALKGRQKAQTAEGSFAGAGAVAVNVAKNTSLAEVTDGTDLNAGGKLSVVSVNRTAAAIKANASTTKSDRGVGIGAAVNIVHIVNTARIGDGMILANELEVLAHMPDPTPVSGITVVKAIRDEGAFVTRLKEQAAGAAVKLLGTLGINGETAGKLAADFAGSFATDMLKDMPELRKLLNSSDGVADALKKAEKLAEDKLTAFAKTAVQPLTELLEEVKDTYALSGSEVEEIFADLPGEFTAQLLKNAAGSVKTLVGKMKDRVLSSAIDMVTDRIQGKGWNTDKLEKMIQDDAKKILDNIVEKSLDSVLQQLYTRVPVLNEDNVNTFRELFSRDMEENAAVLAQSLKDTFRTEVFDFEKVLVLYEQQDLQKVVTDKLKSAMKAGTVALSNDLLDTLAGELEISIDKPEDLADKHVITTQAISGAGAKDVGVAGSAAIAVISARTEAAIAAGTKELTVSKALSLDAQENRRVTTTASAAVDGDGNADTNKGAGKTDQKDTGSGSEGKKEGTLYSVAGPVEGAPEGMKVAVDGREAKDGKWQAAAGDTVRVTIPKKEGTALESLAYAAGGKTVKIGTVGSENAQETVYIFTMPEADVTAVTATMGPAGENGGSSGESGSTETKKPAVSATETKNGRGQSVGVGASFAFVYGSSDIAAVIGARAAAAGAVKVGAGADHGEKTTAVAGTDPLQTNGKASAGVKDIGVDAAVAVNALDTAIKAAAEQGTLRTAGYQDKDADGNRTEVSGDLILHAAEKGKTENNASGYATGSNTAVGAAVAVNVASSGIRAVMDADADLAGSASISADSHSQDLTNAFATALGADIQRALDKAGAAKESIQNGANKLLDGSIWDSKAKDKKDTKNSGNKTAAKINDKLNSKKDKDSGQESSSNLSLSANALRSQDVSAQGAAAGNEGAGEAGSVIKQETGKDVTTTKNDGKSKFQIAAAVGVSVTDHAAQALVAGRIKAGKGAEVFAENAGNFSTLGTGAAMSLANRANSIAAGVAVSVSNNRAETDIRNDIAAKGDISLTAKLTQNMDDPFRSKLAAQALSGSVSGSKSTVTVAGAVAVAVSHASSTVNVAEGTADAIRKMAGANMAIEATDKSKLAVRAGGVSISKGSSVGMGIASGTLVSGNKVEAAIGDYTEITAKSLKLNAEKMGVTKDDFVNPLSMRDLVTDSSKLTDEQRKSADTKGLLDIKKGKDDKNYSVSINLKSQDLLKLVEAANILASQNYYTEAIAGSVNLGQESKLSLAGSAAVTVFSNTVEAKLGSNSKILLTDGGADINASADTNTRVISGAVSLASATASVGAMVAVLTDNDRVSATTGDNTQIEAAGNVTQNAKADADIQLFTAEAAVAAGGQSQAAAGGAVNVMVLKNTAESVLGKGVKIKAGGDAAVTSDTSMDLMGLSVSVNAGSGKVAAGGTVNVIVDRAKSLATVHDLVTIEAGKNATITSDVRDQMISGIASASASSGAGVAGAVSVLVSRSQAETALGTNTAVTAAEGTVKATANSDAWMLNAGLEAAGGGNAGVGGAISVNVFDRDAQVKLSNSALSAGKNILAQASGKDTSILPALALSGGGNAGISGTVVVMAESNRVKTLAGDGMTATAKHNAVFESYLSDFTVAAAGALAGGGTAGVGAAVVTVVKNNKVTTELGESIVSASNTLMKYDGVTTRSGEATKGIWVGANAKETQIGGGAGGAAAGTAAVTGITAVLVNNNTVTADASKARLSAGGKEISEDYYPHGTVYYRRYNWRRVAYDYYPVDPKTLTEADFENETYYYETQKSFLGIRYTDHVKLTYGEMHQIISGVTEGDAAVRAADDTRQVILAGGLNGAGTAGVGLSAVVVVSNKDVKALAKAISGTNTTVTAGNKDKVTQIAVSAGGAGTASVELGAAVQVLKSKVNAESLGEMTAVNNATVSADNDASLLNIVAAAGFSGTAAVAPVAAVTYFKGESKARLAEGAQAHAKNITVSASGNKDIDSYTAGAAGSGTAGVSGVANIIIAKDNVKADIAAGTESRAGGNVNVDARSDYRLRGMSAAIGAAGTAGVAVNAVVSVLKGNTAAEIGGDVKADGAVNVSASGARDVISAEADIGAGMAGVGVGVMVLVSGAKMSQDAADMLAYGNAADKDHGKTTFDADKTLSSMRKAGIDTTDISDLGQETEGNGHRESELQAGHTEKVDEKDGNGNRKTISTFDASGTYTSSDLKNTDISSDSEKGRGENQEFENDTEDIRNAKTINTYMYMEDPQDAVTARILNSAAVEAQSVSVTATQPVAADLIGATLGAGAAGIGITAAVAILHSNVIAASHGMLRTSGSVRVRAASVSGALSGDSDEDAQKRNEGILELLTNKTYSNNNEKQKAEEQKKNDIAQLKDIVTTRSIRAFGLAAGAGGAGIGVSVGVVLTDNITEAMLGGSVESTGDVSVEAKHDYGAVMAATGTLAAGATAAGASVAVAQATGTVKAAIDRDAEIRTKSGVNVSTTSSVGADSIAVTAGAGAMAINAGVAVALNRLKQTTAILSGSNVEADGEVKVNASSNTNSRSYLAGISIGGTAVSLNAAVSDVSADINTYIGESKPVRMGDPSDMPMASVRANKVTVYNNTNSAAVPMAVSAALGGIAVGGNVLLAFNNTTAEARVDNAGITAADLSVTADLAGRAVSRLASAQVGALAVGISVNFADMRAENRAAVYNSILDVSNSTTIATGQGQNNKTTADAQTVTGNMGAITIGVNAAIARNKTLNYATILGDKTLRTGNLTIHGKGESEADASMEGLSISGLNAALTAVVAVNDADTRSTLVTNHLKAKGLTFDVTQTGTTNANAKIGSASLIGLGLTFAMAYGRNAAVVDVAIDAKDEKDASYDFIKSLSTASSTTKSNISNQNFSLLSVTGTYGAAYSQDLFSSRIQLTGGKQEVRGNVDVGTNYTLKTASSVNPSSSGVSASLASLSVNAAAAKNTAYVGTDFEISMGTPRKPSTVGGNVSVTTQGTAVTDAKVIPAAISVNLAEFGANLARSDMSMQQAATFRVGGNVNVNGGVSVQSLVKNEGVTATASVGPNGPKDKSVSVSLAQLNVTRAVATENMTSNASVLGAAYGSEEVLGLVDNGSYVTKQVQKYNYDFVTDVIYYYTIEGRERSYRISNYNFDENALMWKVASDIAYAAVWQYLIHVAGAERDLIQKSFVEAYHQYTGLNAWEWQGLVNFFMEHCDLWLRDGQEIIVGTLWGHNIFNYMVSAGYLQPTRTEYIYPWITSTETVWEPKMEEMTVFAPVFDTDKNILNAGKVTIYAGFEDVANGATGASASTGGAKDVSVSLLSAGSVLAEATSADTVSAMLEGIHAKVAGEASVKAQAGTASTAFGAKTADFSIMNMNSSDAKAMVGSRRNRQTVNVVIGKGAELSADTVAISAVNKGTVQSRFDGGTTVTGLGLESSSQPTESWYDTLVTIGSGAQVKGSKDVSITSSDTPGATSTVSTNSIGILFNANTMKGQNSLNQENNIDIGSGALVYSEDGNITIEASQTTAANASTSVISKSLIGGNMATAQNTVDRTVRVNIGSGAKVQNNGSYGNVVIRAAAGNGDYIRTSAYMDGASLVDLSKTKAYTAVTSNAEIIIKDGVEISSPTGWSRRAGNITLEAWNTSRNGGNPGIATSANTNAGSLIPVPDSVAKNDLNFKAYISVNEENKPGTTVIETKNDHNVSISATNRGMNVQATTNSVGKGGVGVSNANSWINANLTNAVWLGNSKLGGNNVQIYAGNGEGDWKSNFKATAYAELKALGGVVAPVTRVTGVQINQIRNVDGAQVLFSANAVSHVAPDPGQSINTNVSSSYKRLELVIKIWFIKITITLTRANIIEELKWYVYDRCDFCGTGIAVDVARTIQKTIDERYETAYENAKGVIAQIQQKARELGVDISAMEAMRLAKGLKVLTYLNTNVPTGTQVLSKGTYGLGDNNGIDELFVTDISVLLEKDVRLAGDALQRYLLLRSNPNQEDVYMLANATRIITSASGKVKYISEVLRTGLPEEAPFSTVDIITALTKQANNNPVIPLGTDGTLQMKEGILTVPQYAVEELRLSEVSAEWLLGHLDSGFMQAYKGDPETLSAYVLTDDTVELPSGFIENGLTPEWSTEDGWIMYWLGDDPETAETPEEMLVYLLVNTETDQVWAFRTSVDMLDRDEGSVMVSLYLFRDRKADRQGEEVYDVIFYDTPEGAESTIQIITDARKGYILEIPRSLKVSLRGITVEGADGKAWAVNGHLYVMDDGLDGNVNLFGGSYTAAITEDTFESNYTLIEGISTGELTVTIKPAQPVWAEKTGEDTAEDLNGVSYIRTEIGWQTEENE